MTFVADRLARFTHNLSMDALPASVARTASTLLADTLACAIAAAAEPVADVVDTAIAYAMDDNSRPVATIIGTDLRTSLRGAALANCTMARHLDANDIYIPAAGSLSGSGHFSDAVPALVAAAEAASATGPELLEAVLAAYEVQAALAESLTWLDRGFHSVSQVTVAVALAAGRLMGLSANQLAHAASLAITSGLFVQTWLQPSVDVPAIKSGAPGLAAERGITCAELAARGFTSAPNAFETFYRFFGDAHPDPAAHFDHLGTDWRTPRNAIKPAPAQIYTQAVIQCAEQLYDQGLRLGDMTRLTIRSNDGACGRVQGSPGAFRPASREAADHSTPFVTAMTLRDGTVTAETYHEAPWALPEVIAAMERMTLVIGDERTSRMNQAGQLGAEIEAEDLDGKVYRARVEQFRGHPDNPLSRDEFVDKLERFIGSDAVLGPGAGSALLELCASLSSGGSISAICEFWNLPAG